MADTANLILPLMSAAQSQKHVTHNEAVLRLDVLVQLAVKSTTLTAPPGSPADGDRYLIASGPTGAWAGKGLNITYYSSGAWVFLPPRKGWLCWDEVNSKLLVWTGSEWSDYASAGGFVTTTTINNNTLPGKLTILGLGGATADNTNRLSINTGAALFNNAGSSINLTLNKNATANDASLTFQVGLSARALVGLLASDDFTIKVSPDGSVFTTAVTLNRTSGAATMSEGYQAIATDAAFTINPFDPANTRHTGTLTAARACTLGTSGALAGQRKRLTRTGGGAFNITFAGKAMATNTWAEAVFDGTAWYLAAYGSL